MNNTQHEYGYMAVGVDIQNDFCPGGSLAVPNGDEIIEPFNIVAEKIRALNGLVILTRDYHPKQTNHFDIWPPHCVAGTEGAEFHNKLVINNNDLIISKGTKVDEDAYSGFQGFTLEGKNLEDIIKDEFKEKQKLILAIGGLATDYCVKETVLDALKLSKSISDKQLVVVAMHNCMRAVNINPDDGLMAVNEMAAEGALFELPTELR